MKVKFVTPYLFIAPNIVLILAFASFPLLFNLYLSFNEITFAETKFIGLKNYMDLLDDRVFRVSLLNTLYYVGGMVPLSLLLSLALALGVNQSKFSANVFRSMYLLPNLIAGVTVGVLWQWIYSPNYGVLNSVLAVLGLPQSQWLQNSNLTMPCLILVGVWMQAGYYMVLYLAGLQSIPREYYDAAACDGAAGWQTFRFVTLPLLRPTTYLILVIATLTSFTIFDTIYVMTGGGPGRASLVLVMYMYQVAFNATNISYAASLSIALFLLIFGFTLAQVKMFRA